MNRRKRTCRVELTRRALRDLREIENFSLKEWGRDLTAKYLDAFQTAIDRIRESPRILRLEPDFAPGLYFFRVKKHFLVCDYSDEVVIVLTVVHTSMDVPARLQELEPRLIAEAKLLRSKL